MNPTPMIRSSNSSRARNNNRISSTSWIGSVGADFDDLEVSVAENSNVGSCEFKKLMPVVVLAEVIQSSEESSNDENNKGRDDTTTTTMVMKGTIDGFADMNLKDKEGNKNKESKNNKQGPLDKSRSSSTHASQTERSRSRSNRRNTRAQRISMFTTYHTTTTLVSSTYHSSELDSFSEDGVSDTELDSDDESFEQASLHEEPQGGDEDDIKSILSSDFDSVELDLNEEPEKQQKQQQPQHDEKQQSNRAKLDWTTDKRWTTLDGSIPSINPDPFVYPTEGQSSSRMISNTSILVQVAPDDSNIKDRKYMEIIVQADDEISLNDDGGYGQYADEQDRDREFTVEYNDTKIEKKRTNVADILEHDPDSQHSSFMLEVGIQRNVSGLTVQSMLRQSGVGNNSQRTRRKGSKRTRPNQQAWQNEAWNLHDTTTGAVAPRNTIDAIPNQPLPPPPPQSQTPSQRRRSGSHSGRRRSGSHSGRRSFSGTEIITSSSNNKSPRRGSRMSHISKVSKVSELSSPEFESSTANNQNYEQTNNNRSRAGSFESSWDSSIDASPIILSPHSMDYKKLRVDNNGSSTSGAAAAESIGTTTTSKGNDNSSSKDPTLLLSQHDNPTFRAGNRLSEGGSNIMDVPPPPPARSATPRNSVVKQHLPWPTLPQKDDDNDDDDDDDERSKLSDMRQLSKNSIATYDSTTQNAKLRHQQSLERLNDQMNAAIGVSSPVAGSLITPNSNSNSKNKTVGSKLMSLGQRRESMKRLREKLRDSFKHAISPSTSTSRKMKN